MAACCLQRVRCYQKGSVPGSLVLTTLSVPVVRISEHHRLFSLGKIRSSCPYTHPAFCGVGWTSSDMSIFHSLILSTTSTGVHKTLFPPHAVVTRAGPLKISQHFAHEGDYSSGTCFCRRKKLQVPTGSTTQHDSNKGNGQKLTFLLT